MMSARLGLGFPLASMGARISAPAIVTAPAMPGISPHDLAPSLAYDLLIPGAALYDGSNRVGTLVNFSGVANCDATQALNTLKPVYDPVGLNGRPCIKADGGDDYMVLGSGARALTAAATAWTEIYVGEWLSATAAFRLVSSFAIEANGSGRMQLGYSDTLAEEVIRWNQGNGGGGTDTAAGASPSGPAIFSRERNFLGRSARAWNNGAVAASVSGIGSAVALPNTNSLRVHQFANSGSPSSQFAHFSLGARFAWPRVLTDGERNGVTQRLGYLWGLSVTL